MKEPSEKFDSGRYQDGHPRLVVLRRRMAKAWNDWELFDDRVKNEVVKQSPASWVGGAVLGMILILMLMRLEATLEQRRREFQ